MADTETNTFDVCIHVGEEAVTHLLGVTKFLTFCSPGEQKHLLSSCYIVDFFVSSHNSLAPSSPLCLTVFGRSTTPKLSLCNLRFGCFVFKLLHFNEIFTVQGQKDREYSAVTTEQFDQLVWLVFANISADGLH